MSSEPLPPASLLPGPIPALPPPLPGQLPGHRALTDRGAVALAASTAVGAWLHAPIALSVAAAVALAALAARRPMLLVIAGLLLGTSLGARSFAGLVPVEPGPFHGTVTLVSDPSPLPFGATADVRAGHRHLELWATGSAAGALERSLAGEQLAVVGRVAPPPPRSPWLVPRHVVGRLTVTHAERAGAGSAPWRAANQFRRLLDRGREPIPEPARSLYAGFVLGDDRTQPPEVVDDFRGAGLTHLLVVSGDNLLGTLFFVRALIYTRVSQDRAEGRSPEEQEADCRAVCEREDWTVIDVLSDKVGASRHSKGVRDGWEEVKRRIASGEVDVLVTWAASRAGRKLADFTDIRDLCAEHEVRWNYGGRTYDLTKTSDRQSSAFEAVVSESYVDQTVDAVKRAMRANAERGRPHGRVLDGYRRVYDEHTRAFIAQEIDAERAAVIRRIYGLYLSGMGIRTIARTLNAEDVPTSTGKSWNDAQVRQVLTRPAYAARCVHKGEVVGPGEWPAIINPEDFDRVQARLKANDTGAVRTGSRGRLLSAVARCSKCGGKMHVGHDRNHRKVYQCRERYCVSRDQVKLDEYVSAVIVSVLADPVASTALTERPTPEVDEATAELAALRQQLEDATDQFINREISATTLGRIEAGLTPCIRAAEAEIRRALVPVKVDVPAEGVAEWWTDLPADQRRTIVGALVASVEVLPTGKGTRKFNPDHVQIHWN